jgi:hypothetical protein
VDDNKKSLADEIELFGRHVDSISDVLVGAVFALQEVSKKTCEALRKFEQEKCEVSKGEENVTIKVPTEHFNRWTKLRQQFEHYELAKSLLPRSLHVTLVSQYDAYLGRLLRYIFMNKPEVLNGSDRKITFEQLTQFSSIEEGREFVIEKEIESVLRTSHIDQFKWMEKAFDITLTKNLSSWPNFIELTERRNLFVHTDGVVSNQYLTVCKVNKCKLDDSITEGSILWVPQKYFESSCECIYEIGIKLGHVLWRKLFPDQRKAADSALTKITYDLIDIGKYQLACNVLDFVCEELKKFSNESYQLVLIVNRAQSYKWNGDEDRCNKIMRAVDWTAKGDEFKLADAVLSADWDRATWIMKRIGTEGPVSKQDYRDWPLFRELRKETCFLETFQEIFGEEFSVKTEIKQGIVEPANCETSGGELEELEAMKGLQPAAADGQAAAP